MINTSNLSHPNHKHEIVKEEFKKGLKTLESLKMRNKPESDKSNHIT